jgi:tyrosine-protein kinase Etk/Wzc
MSPEPAPRFDAVRLVRHTLARRWALALAVFAAVAVPGVVGVALTTSRVYEASTTLFFEEPRDEHPLLRGLTPPEAAALNLAVLHSRSLALAVVEALPRLAREELAQPRGWPAAVAWLDDALRRLLGREISSADPRDAALAELQQWRMAFTPARDGIVVLTARARAPAVAMQIANTYVDVLLARTGFQAREQARAVRELIDGQMAQARRSLAETEAALRRLQGGSGQAAPAEHVRVALARLAELENALAEVQVGKDIAQGRLGYLRGAPPRAPRAAAPSAPPLAGSATNAQRERVGHLEAKLAALREKFTDEHPLVVAARAETDGARDQLRAALTGQLEPKPGGAAVAAPAERAALARQMADLEVEVATLEAREESLRQRIVRARQSLSATGAQDAEHARLAHAVESQRNLLNLYAERSTAARMGEQSELRNIRVVDPAAFPTAPTATPMVRSLLLVLLTACAIGLGVAGLVEHVREVVETEDDAARITGLPVLGAIGLADTPQGPGPTPGMPLRFGEAIAPTSPALESVRAVATALEVQGPRRLHTVLVTSPSAGEGKTTTVLNLAEAMVETGRRVLLLDADLRRPAAHRALRVPNEPGLADVLRSPGIPLDEAIRNVEGGLAVVPAGGRHANPGALLRSPALAQVLEQARAEAELVLFDSAAVCAVSDDLHLAALVDGVVLVVRSGVTSRRSLALAKARLNAARAPLVGVIVNGLSRRETRRRFAEYAAYVASTHEKGLPS